MKIISEDYAQTDIIKTMAEATRSRYIFDIQAEVRLLFLIDWRWRAKILSTECFDRNWLF